MEKDEIEIYDEKMIPLNENLYDDFFVQELEARLETDPLAMGGLLDLVSQEGEVDSEDCIVHTGDCTENSCTDDCSLQLCSCMIDICDCIIKDVCECVITF